MKPDEIKAGRTYEGYGEYKGVFALIANKIQDDNVVVIDPELPQWPVTMPITTFASWAIRELPAEEATDEN